MLCAFYESFFSQFFLTATVSGAGISGAPSPWTSRRWDDVHDLTQTNPTTEPRVTANSSTQFCGSRTRRGRTTSHALSHFPGLFQLPQLLLLSSSLHGATSGDFLRSSVEIINVSCHLRWTPRRSLNEHRTPRIQTEPILWNVSLTSTGTWRWWMMVIWSLRSDGVVRTGMNIPNI